MYGIPKHQNDNAAKMQQITRENLDRQFQKSQLQHQMMAQQMAQNAAMSDLQSRSNQIAKEMKQKAQNIADKYNNTVQSLQSQYNQNISNINVNLGSLISTNQGLVKQANSLGSDCANLATQCQKLQEQYKAHAKQNENLYSSVQKLAGEMDASNKEAVALSEKCKLGIAEVKNLDENVGDLSLKLGFFLSQEKNTNQVLEKANAQMKELKKIIEMSKEEKAKLIAEQNLELQKIHNTFTSLFSQLNISDENNSNAQEQQKK